MDLEKKIYFLIKLVALFRHQVMFILLMWSIEINTIKIIESSTKLSFSTTYKVIHTFISLDLNELLSKFWSTSL